MTAEFLGLDLWDLLVYEIFGSFGLALLGIGVIIFLILAVMGRMSKPTIINYLLVYLMAMSTGFGLRLISFLVMFGIILWCFNEIRQVTSG